MARTRIPNPDLYPGAGGGVKRPRPQPSDAELERIRRMMLSARNTATPVSRPSQPRTTRSR